ncbi:perlucin-like protein [Saccostrea cucullata]|uniref:perlucin-like protein n=1 Tax=Saccostrea cuccullata TaxID=36930 RepID=UPI002ED3C62D
MDWVLFFLITTLTFAHGDILTDFMSRNLIYDDRSTSSTNIISTQKYRSSRQCASYCTRAPECKSILFNSKTQFCQLMLVQLDSVSDIGPQSTKGWRYYLRKTGKQASHDLTTISSEALTTALFDCNMWHKFNDHWYKWDNTYRDFSSSQAFCSALSTTSYVTEVTSQAENDWLIKLTADHCGAPYEYWLNAYDTDDSGSFNWLKSGETTNYTNWFTVNNEPNNPSEECVVISTGYKGVWNDISCTEQRPVVCERDSD